MQQRTVTVWDPCVRIFHWSLVCSFVVAWVSADDWMDLHHWAGYTASALILFRVVWGFTGSHYARFKQFVKGPANTMKYITAMTQKNEPRFVGHNPAGSLMIVALIGVVFITSVTGWMYTLDRFWGVEWVEEMHEIFSHLMLAMVGVHILGVVYSSIRHKENLPRSMLNGRKRAADGSDVS